MTIDYDRLRVTVQNLDAPDHKLARIAQWAVGDQAEDLARELLALRDEIERTRDRIKDELERTPVELQSARITLHTERVHMLALCTHLLGGEFE